MTPRTATIIGSPLSPYVRKGLAVCALKGIEVEIDPLVAFFGDERFSKLSPVRRIPVYRDAHLTLYDSSVICQYLEDAIRARASIPKTSVSARRRAGLRNMPTPASVMYSPGEYSKPR